MKRIADRTSWIGVHQVFPLTTAFGSLADGMEQAQIVSAQTQDLLAELRRRSARLDARDVDAEGEALYLHAGGDDRLKLATKVEGNLPKPAS